VHSQYQSNGLQQSSRLPYSPWRMAHHKLAHALLSNYVHRKDWSMDDS